MDRALLVAAALSSGCLRDTTFHCTDDPQCGPDGKCEPVGFCSFPDTGCASGRRFGSLSGGSADQCVEMGSNGNCPSDYMAAGDQGHVYKLQSNANWDEHQANCSSEGGYLAIPDDATEQQAILDIAGGNTIWIGVDDMASEGDYVTVKGVPATYLPWAPGEPNNSGGPGSGPANCEQLQDDGFHDFRCNNDAPAVCECEP